MDFNFTLECGKAFWTDGRKVLKIAKIRRLLL
jgi:hypothetical protein